MKVSVAEAKPFGGVDSGVEGEEDLRLCVQSMLTAFFSTFF